MGCVGSHDETKSISSSAEAQVGFTLGGTRSGGWTGHALRLCAPGMIRGSLTKN